MGQHVFQLNLDLAVSDILQVIVWRVFIVVGLASLAEASDAAADDAAAEYDSDAYEEPQNPIWVWNQSCNQF